MGDLDGDGAPDVFVGAHFGESGAGYGFRGPHSGTRSAAAADWLVQGEVGDWLGIASGIGDFDGDGAQDLAVGASRSYYVGTTPGEVLVWFSPAPGVYAAADAPVRLTSGMDTPDAFGMALAGGDFDGDGREDLAIGAPRDRSIGDYGGSVTVVYGNGL